MLLFQRNEHHTNKNKRPVINIRAARMLSPEKCRYSLIGRTKRRRNEKNIVFSDSVLSRFFHSIIFVQSILYFVVFFLRLAKYLIKKHKATNKKLWYTAFYAALHCYRNKELESDEWKTRYRKKNCCQR